MKHKKEWETCDECGKEMTSQGGSIKIAVWIEREFRGDKGYLCSITCAEKWLSQVLHLLDQPGN